MTELLEKAFQLAAQLSAEDQDKIASLLLAELESERRWETLFADSQQAMAKLANAAIEDHEAGGSQDLIPEEL